MNVFQDSLLPPPLVPLHSFLIRFPLRKITLSMVRCVYRMEIVKTCLFRGPLPWVEVVVSKNYICRFLFEVEVGPCPWLIKELT